MSVDLYLKIRLFGIALNEVERNYAFARSLPDDIFTVVATDFDHRGLLPTDNPAPPFTDLVGPVLIECRAVIFTFAVSYPEFVPTLCQIRKISSLVCKSCMINGSANRQFRSAFERDFLIAFLMAMLGFFDSQISDDVLKAEVKNAVKALTTVSLKTDDQDELNTFYSELNSRLDEVE